MRKEMNDITQKLIVALVIVPVLLAVFRGPKEMAIAAGAIGVALFFANIDKFSRFKGGGIEAELRTAVGEAYAAIEQLKELGISLSSPIVDELAISGRMLQFIHLKYKLERVAKIADTLRRLGASPAEIEEVCSTLYQRVTSDHIRGVLRSLREANPEKEPLFKGVDDGKMDDWDRVRLETFIKENQLKTTEDTQEWMRDLEFFLRTRTLRREEQWQS
jgi:hypothetical protein